MNKRDEHDDGKLLAGAFHDDWANGPASAFARAAAASARRRRAMRRAMGAVTAAAALVAVTWGALRPPPVATRPPATASTPAAHGYEVISDDELLTQLHDRALLMVKKANGQKEFVLLTPAEEPPNGD